MSAYGTQRPPKTCRATLPRSIFARLVFHELREPVIGRFRRALESFKIDVDDAEPPALAFHPLEIIEQ